MPHLHDDRPRQPPLFPELTPAPTLRDVADAVRLSGLGALPTTAARADEARYQEVRVQSALTSSNGMHFRWALNPYRGCTHACEYCYARKYQRHLELGAGDEFSSVIFVKTNLPEVLRRELGRPRWARDLVAVGTATDPYQPIEGHYRLTRRSLEALAHSRTPFSIVTKGPMVVRDLDILRDASRVVRAQVFMSVPSVDDRLWLHLEPGTAPPAQRLKAIRQLADANIETGVLMMPLVPGLTTSRTSIERTMRAIADTGVRFVGADVARLDVGVREHFLAFLERTFPHLVAGYERPYAGVHAPGEYVGQVDAMVRVEAARAGVGRRPIEPVSRRPTRSADAGAKVTNAPSARQSARRSTGAWKRSTPFRRAKTAS